MKTFFVLCKKMDSKTVSELRDIATAMEIKGRSTLKRKEDLVKAIKKAEKKAKREKKKARKAKGGKNENKRFKFGKMEDFRFNDKIVFKAFLDAIIEYASTINTTDGEYYFYVDYDRDSTNNRFAFLSNRRNICVQAPSRDKAYLLFWLLRILMDSTVQGVATTYQESIYQEELKTVLQYHRELAMYDDNTGTLKLSVVDFEDGLYMDDWVSSFSTEDEIFQKRKEVLKELGGQYVSGYNPYSLDVWTGPRLAKVMRTFF